MSPQGIASTRTAIDARLPVVIMIGAALNAFIVRAAEQIGANDAQAFGLGISPFQLVTLFVAARLSLAVGDSGRFAPPWFEAIVLVMILVPSSSVSWLALAIYAAAGARHARGERRIGAMLFLGLALSALWSSVVLKWLAAPVTSAEALDVGQMLAVLRPDIVHMDSTFGMGGGI